MKLQSNKKERLEETEKKYRKVIDKNYLSLIKATKFTDPINSQKPSHPTQNRKFISGKNMQTMNRRNIFLTWDRAIVQQEEHLVTAN